MTKTESQPPAAVVASKQAIIQTSTGGRGFIVSAGEDDRYIITAAHCLPHFPEPHLASFVEERTYRDILSGLGKPEPKVWAELVEFNAASDWAVLGAPDNQALSDEYEQYEAFTENTTIRIGQSPPAPPPLLLPDFDSEAFDSEVWKNWQQTEVGPFGVEAPAWMLSLDGEWLRCMVRSNGRFLEVSEGHLIKSGMSGSPIINDDGAAIGLMSTSGGDGWNVNPSLSDCLPPWLQRKFSSLTFTDLWNETN
jgi:hypothetical protein